MKTAEEQNLQQLRKLFEEYEDARDALRAFTGDSITVLAQRIGMRRTDMNMMLSPTSRRRHLPERRLLEAELVLPAYSLDNLLDTPHTTEE